MSSKIVQTFPSRFDEYEELLTKNRIWIGRTQGVGHPERERRHRHGRFRAFAARLRRRLRRAQVFSLFQLRRV